MKRRVAAIGLGILLAISVVGPAGAAEVPAPASTANVASRHNAPPPHPKTTHTPVKPVKDRSKHPAPAPKLPSVRPSINRSVAGSAVVTNVVGTNTVTSATITVDSSGDPATGTSCAAGHAAGTCSLRAAIAMVDAEGPDEIDTIVIPSGMTVTLSESLSLGPLDLTHSMAIVGTGATVDGQGVEVFDQYNSPSVWITGLTITNGVTTGDGGGIYLANGSLVLDHVTLTGNTAADGGGIYTASDGQLWMDDCVLTHNTATGGLAAAPATATSPSTATTPNATVYAHGNGGGTYTYGSAAITRTLFSENYAEQGAGLYNYDGNVTLQDCIVTANSSPSTFGYGVGVYNDEVMDIADSEISHNTAPWGADGVGLDTQYLLTVENTVFDSNMAAGDNTTYGGAIYDDGDTTTLTNVSLLNNVVAPSAGRASTAAVS